MLGLPHLPKINARSFASQNMQPVLDALPSFAPSPSIQETATQAVSEAGKVAAESIQTARDAVAPSAQTLSAALGPISQIRHAVDAAIAPAVRHLSMFQGHHEEARCCTMARLSTCCQSKAGSYLP